MPSVSEAPDVEADTSFLRENPEQTYNIKDVLEVITDPQKMVEVLDVGEVVESGKPWFVYPLLAAAVSSLQSVTIS